MAKPKTPTSADTSVGSMIRLYRKRLGLSQAALAECLGLSFQQVQKYENGISRVAASRLQKIAEVLRVPISDFLGVPAAANPSVTDSSRELDILVNFLSTGEGLQLNWAFLEVVDPKVRRRIIDLVRVLGDDRD